MNKLKELKYIETNKNVYNKNLGNYEIRVYINGDESLTRRIIKNSINYDIQKFNSVEELENDKIFNEVLIEYNRFIENRMINEEEVGLSGLEKEKKTYRRKIEMDDTKEVKLEPEEIRGVN